MNGSSTIDRVPEPEVHLLFHVLDTLRNLDQRLMRKISYPSLGLCLSQEFFSLFVAIAVQLQTSYQRVSLHCDHFLILLKEREKRAHRFSYVLAHLAFICELVEMTRIDQNSLGDFDASNFAVPVDLAD